MKPRQGRQPEVLGRWPETLSRLALPVSVQWRSRGEDLTSRCKKTQHEIQTNSVAGGLPNALAHDSLLDCPIFYIS